jgi:outer membrane immunogenic protein
MKFATTVRLFSAAAVVTLLLAPAAQADSGFFIGGSIGESDVSDELSLNDNSVAYKAMLGYVFDMPVVDFGVELEYADFGGASENFGGGNRIDVDVTGLAGFGTVGLDFGLFGMFAKAGFASWDLDLSATGLPSVSAGGSDPAYGIGMRFTFSSVEIRAEYERFEVEDSSLGIDDSINLVSVGAIWRF